MIIEPIAYINTDFREKFGIPRQSGRVRTLTGKIVFEPKFKNAEALRGIEKFSHLWIIFDFSKAHRKDFSPTVRPPRLGGNERVGVFASRSPFRPNSLGLSCVRLEGIDNGEITVSGIDMLDKTPIYDIKPYIPYSDCVPDADGGFTDEVERKVLKVDFPKDLLQKIPASKREAAVGCLSEDPRPPYHNDGRFYSMQFGDFDIHFKVENLTLSVVGVDELFGAAH